MAEQRDFNWNAGEDFSFSVVYMVDGVAVDLTGAEARMDIARLNSDGSPGQVVVSLNSSDHDGLDEPGEGDNEITIDTNGTILVDVPRALTYSELNGGVYAYDLFIRTADGKQTLLTFGTITVRKAVTTWL